MDLRLYLETPWPPGTELKPSRANDITLFFKYYDPWSETLRYVGHKYVPRSIKVCKKDQTHGPSALAAPSSCPFRTFCQAHVSFSATQHAHVAAQ
jgi:ICP0-binding domain of Ubiquitin-specific protease 7